MNEKILRSLIVRLLNGEAHMSFKEVVDDFPMDHINDLPPNVPYSPWQLLEHMRFTQHDILEFIQNDQYVEPKFPEDYWPGNGLTADPDTWQQTIQYFISDLESLQKIALDNNIDLYQSIPWGTGQTVIEELLKVVDHNAYDIGEFGILRQIMHTWGKGHKM